MDEKRNITVELTHDDVVNLVAGVNPSCEHSNFFIRKRMGDYTGTQWGITGWQWNREKLGKLSTEYLWNVYQCIKNNCLPKY